MRQSATRELFAYWTALRGERAAPERADVDPAAIRAILPDTFMLEVDGAGLFPFLLSGARANALFGVSLREKSFVDLFEPADRRQVARMCAGVSDEMAPIVAGARGAARGTAPVDVELLLLPLRHRGKTHARLLGSFAPAHFPTWLGLSPMESLTMISMRMIAPQQSPRRAQEGEPAEPRVNRRAHLSVIEGGLSARFKSSMSIAP